MKFEDSAVLATREPDSCGQLAIDIDKLPPAAASPSCDVPVQARAAIVHPDEPIRNAPDSAANTSTYLTAGQAASQAHAVPYRFEAVATRRQNAVFIAMQLVLLLALLWLSSTIVTILLSQFMAPATVSAVVLGSCAFAIFWQGTYIYRMLGMKRAVLTDDTAPQGMRVAMATTIVPSREFELLRTKLEAMAQVDPCGNRLDHWVLDEEDDPRVRLMISEFNLKYRHRGIRIFHFSRKNIERYNEPPAGRSFKCFQARQKGGNINAWLDATRQEAYEVISFLDLDHIPRSNFFRMVLPYFRDQGVAFVQGPESFRNRNQNFISRAASFERDTFFGLIHRSFFGLGMPALVGSHTTFRANTFDALGGFYPVHLTEDYLMMLRLRALGKRGIYVDKVLAVGELPSTWSGYLGQQQRWASGGLDLLMRYFPAMWRSFSVKEKLFTFVLLNYYAWGAFFILSKVAIFSLLLGGIEVRLGGALLAAVAAFTLVSMIANYLWERQFFIEPEQPAYLLENALMNNFLGGLYFLSLLKAWIRPNTPFTVTPKTGAKTSRVAWMRSYPFFAGLLLAAEVVALVCAFVFAQDRSGPAAGYDIMAIPLVISVLATMAILFAFRRHENTSAKAPCSAPGNVGTEAAAQSVEG
ncbi:hypothetical protein BH11PSE11_BH11PSE11_19520 [soil metagenome]